MKTKRINNILSLLMGFVISFCTLTLIIGVSVANSPLAEYVDYAAPVAIGVCVFCALFVRVPEGNMAFDRTVIIFRNTLEEKLFPDNSFYKRSIDDSAFIDGEVVNFPVAGDNPGVEINRAVLPAPITKRTDDENTYPLKEFTSNPTLITNTEEIVANYAKRASILRNHQRTINTKIADFFANIWLPDGADNIVRTSGAARPGTAPSATGDRKKVTEADIINAANMLDRMDVPVEGRFCCLPSDFISDLRGIDNFKRQDALGFSNIPSGVIARIHGFYVYSRSSLGVYDNTATPVKKALGAAGAATDNQAALFWCDEFVNRAEGNAKVFMNPDKAEYYGSIFSAMVRAGGKIRKDKKGVVALVETAA